MYTVWCDVLYMAFAKYFEFNHCKTDHLVYFCIDTQQLYEHQTGSGEADEEDKVSRSGLQTPGPVDDGGLPVHPGET